MFPALSTRTHTRIKLVSSAPTSFAPSPPGTSSPPATPLIRSLCLAVNSSVTKFSPRCQRSIPRRRWWHRSSIFTWLPTPSASHDCDALHHDQHPSMASLLYVYVPMMTCSCNILTRRTTASYHLGITRAFIGSMILVSGHGRLCASVAPSLLQLPSAQDFWPKDPQTSYNSLPLSNGRDSSSASTTLGFYRLRRGVIRTPSSSPTERFSHRATSQPLLPLTLTATSLSEAAHFCALPTTDCLFLVQEFPTAASSVLVTRWLGCSQL